MRTRKQNRETLSAGKWFPIAWKLTVRCCRCGMAHRHSFRLRKGQLEMKVD